MTFQKKHKLGFTSDDPLDKTPLCIRLKPGVKDKLKAIPNWQERLREYVDELVKQSVGG